MDDWQSQQQADELILRQDAAQAILKARPFLSEDEIMAIAYSAGLANEIYKELRK
jgi:hypothetical protein